MAEKLINISICDDVFQVGLPRDHEYFEDGWKSWASGDEKEMFEFLNRSDQDGHVFLDIGAWVGMVTLPASRRFSKVYAFEADPISAADLKRNLELNNIGNVEVVEKLVGTKAGKSKLYSMYSGNNSGSSIFHTDGKTAFDVDEISLSDFIEFGIGGDQGIALKMDIEGAEYDVIPSMGKVMRSGRIHAMSMSLHPTLLAKAMPGNSFVNKVKRRIFMSWKTLKVFWTLRPYKIVNNAAGVRTTYAAEFLSILLRGRQIDGSREIYLAPR